MLLRILKLQLYIHSSLDWQQLLGGADELPGNPPYGTHLHSEDNAEHVAVVVGTFIMMIAFCDQCNHHLAGKFNSTSEAAGRDFHQQCCDFCLVPSKLFCTDFIKTTLLSSFITEWAILPWVRVRYQKTADYATGVCLAVGCSSLFFPGSTYFFYWHGLGEASHPNSPDIVFWFAACLYMFINMSFNCVYTEISVIIV